ncbi:MAG TPA: pantetheine-phosphate adenylyltransferase [Turneriella sp.]|nr:pantetheine-phosphate adenylyltransferase [Turneriella sp.]HNE20126.1 pantetheine-phosphate adenylyltransferase [Turneriella sp.]HNJ66525.1 pantetheine-phosphate adenylyltransferase [Turneriella sp.]HNL11328.1 pantetheine-phosphate adenylyltransferase [Turneriella sp.]HNL53565.1 pantetheine-phosphate adenylyltransferase [Turneriella sp.]
MRSAVYPGSFDPFTNGHLDIVQRAIRIVDKLTIAVLKNTSKKGMFSPEERVDIIREVVRDYPQVEVETFEGLLVDFCRERKTRIVIRGLRAVSDFDYEHAIFLMNRKLLPDLETMFLMAGSENSFISSTIVKEVAHFGGNIADQVPAIVFERMQKQKLQNRNE